MKHFIPSEHSLIAAVTQAIRASRRLVVLTGAGISAESGVPTFRDAQTGLWAKYRPEDLATPQAFLREPRLVWAWYAWRRDLVARARPNAGHIALVALENACASFTLLTQNVDGLHQLAGSHRVLELHGNLFANIRFDDRTTIRSAEMSADVPPRCLLTGQPVRPGVVWFGEALDASTLDNALEAARRCDVFLSIGTSSVVEPAASLPILARQGGAVLIEINPTSTPLTPVCEYSLRGTAAELLPALIAELDAP